MVNFGEPYGDECDVFTRKSTPRPYKTSEGCGADLESNVLKEAQNKIEGSTTTAQIGTPGSAENMTIQRQTLERDINKT